MCIAIDCSPGFDVINFEIKFIFLIKLFFYVTKTSRQKFKYFERKELLRILTGKKHCRIKLHRLEKSTNVGVWAVGTLSQLFMRGSWTEAKLSKKSKAVTGKTQFSVIGSFCNYHSVCLNIGFWYGSFVWKWCLFNLNAFN